MDENIETLNEGDMVPPQKFTNPKYSGVDNFEDNRIDSAPQKGYDLSNDIYVNQLMADAGAKTNPEAEVFESIDGHIPSVQYYPHAASSANRVAPFSFYPGRSYERQMQQGPFQNVPYYAPPMNLVNDPYYNRFQQEQIMFVPLVNDQQLPYSIPSMSLATSSSAQGVPQNTRTSTSNTTPDKYSSAPSTT